MVPVAIVSTAQTTMVRRQPGTEPQMVLSVLRAALDRVGLTSADIGFTCSGSCDYLSGHAFAFQANLDAVGAWPPIAESHVEMDGAWALFEAWVRLQEGDIDTALVYGSGKTSPGDPAAVFPLQLDPYSLAPLGVDPVSLAALQACALLDAGLATERDFAEVVARSRSAALANPYAQVTGTHDVDDLLRQPYVRRPLRRHDLPPVTDGAAAVVLAAGDRAASFCDRPAWITGIDHRIDVHQPGMRDLTRSRSTALAAAGAGVSDGPIEVAELSATFSPQELILRRELGLDGNGNGNVVVNPSGGPLAANPIMATGLVRMVEAAGHVMEQGRHRVLAHATAGQVLQQNLVCVLEDEP